jgi:hypothetical protein
MGFRHYDGNKFRLQTALRGNRYSASNFPKSAAAQPLNRAYSVRVTTPESVVSRGARALLTPITIGVDGALVLSAIALFPITLPIALQLGPWFLLKN